MGEVVANYKLKSRIYRNIANNSWNVQLLRKEGDEANTPR